MNMILEVPPYVRVKDACKYFGMSDREIWRLIAANEIDASKSGKHWLVSSASMFKLLKRRQNIHKEEVNV